MNGLFESTWWAEFKSNKKISKKIKLFTIQYSIQYSEKMQKFYKITIIKFLKILIKIQQNVQ